MDIMNRVFRKNMADCPRCLGKGHVAEAFSEAHQQELVLYVERVINSKLGR
mgnify:CR=1 FL=1